MSQQSPYFTVKRLEGEILTCLNDTNIANEDRTIAALVRGLRNQLVDSRLDIRDYELAESKNEQLVLKKSSIDRLANVRQTMLQLSEYNIFSAIEIAQLTAQIERIIEMLA